MCAGEGPGYFPVPGTRYSGCPLLFGLQWANATGDEGARLQNKLMVFTRPARIIFMARRSASLGCSLDARKGEIPSPLPLTTG